MDRPTQEQSEQLAALWTQAQPIVSAYIRTTTPDFHQAEDILQRVAITLVRKFSEFDTARPFVPWAIGFARLEVLRSRREHATDRHQFDIEVIDQVADLYASEEINFAAWRSALQTCVAKLDGRNRQALLLRYTQNFAPQQIAEQLSMTANAVRQLLHRVREALRLCIQREASRGAGHE